MNTLIVYCEVRIMTIFSQQLQMCKKQLRVSEGEISILGGGQMGGAYCKVMKTVPRNWRSRLCS